MKSIKKIICLMIVALFCIVAVVPASASVVTPDFLKDKYDISYSESDFPFYVIMKDNNNDNHLFLLSNTEFLYVDTDIEEIYAKNYVIQYICKSDGTHTSNTYTKDEYVQILSDFTIVNSNFDILDAYGNVYFEKN